MKTKIFDYFFQRNELIQQCILSKFSNLEHLKEVASSLNLSENHETLNFLCEKELAALINTFYQVRLFLALEVLRVIGWLLVCGWGVEG